MANLNINSVLKSIDQLRIIMQNSSIDILALMKQKLTIQCLMMKLAYLDIIISVKIEIGMVGECYYMCENLYHFLNEMTY